MNLGDMGQTGQTRQFKNFQPPGHYYTPPLLGGGVLQGAGPTHRHFLFILTGIFLFDKAQCFFFPQEDHLHPQVIFFFIFNYPQGFRREVLSKKPLETELFGHLCALNVYRKFQRSVILSPCVLGYGLEYARSGRNSTTGCTAKAADGATQRDMKAETGEGALPVSDILQMAVH